MAPQKYIHGATDVFGSLVVTEEGVEIDYALRHFHLRSMHGRRRGDVPRVCQGSGHESNHQYAARLVQTVSPRGQQAGTATRGETFMRPLFGSAAENWPVREPIE